MTTGFENAVSEWLTDDAASVRAAPDFEHRMRNKYVRIRRRRIAGRTAVACALLVLLAGPLYLVFGDRESTFADDQLPTRPQTTTTITEVPEESEQSVSTEAQAPNETEQSVSTEVQVPDDLPELDIYWDGTAIVGREIGWTSGDPHDRRKYLFDEETLTWIETDQVLDARIENPHLCPEWLDCAAYVSREVLPELPLFRIQRVVSVVGATPEAVLLQSRVAYDIYDKENGYTEAARIAAADSGCADGVILDYWLTYGFGDARLSFYCSTEAGEVFEARVPLEEYLDEGQLAILREADQQGVTGTVVNVDGRVESTPVLLVSDQKAFYRVNPSLNGLETATDGIRWAPSDAGWLPAGIWINAVTGGEGTLVVHGSDGEPTGVPILLLIETESGEVEEIRPNPEAFVGIPSTIGPAGVAFSDESSEFLLSNPPRFVDLTHRTWELRGGANEASPPRVRLPDVVAGDVAVGEKGMLIRVVVADTSSDRRDATNNRYLYVSALESD